MNEISKRPVRKLYEFLHRITAEEAQAVTVCIENLFALVCFINEDRTGRSAGQILEVEAHLYPRLIIHFRPEAGNVVMDLVEGPAIKKPEREYLEIIWTQCLYKAASFCLP